MTGIQSVPAHSLIDLTGLRVGRLTVLTRLPLSGSRKRRYWECRCDCGVVKPICGLRLRLEKTKSCGCLKKEMLASGKLQYKHGHAKDRKMTPEFRAWTAMRQRCHRPSHKNFHIWGGKGVTVCDRWMESFDNFLKDMGLRPSRAHSLDRKDSSGNYDPSNCRWATTKEQNANKSCNRLIVVDGKTFTVTAAAEEYGVVPIGTAFSRIRHGWDPSAAVKTPPFGPRVLAKAAL